MGGLRDVCLERDSRGEHVFKVWCRGVSRDGVVEGWVALGATWLASGRSEQGTDWAQVKGAVRQPLLWDLFFKWSVVHLNVVGEASFRGPVLGHPCHVGQGSK